MIKNEDDIIKSFELWHKSTKQSTKYKMYYTRNRNNTEYKDYRVNWAFIAYRAGVLKGMDYV